MIGDVCMGSYDSRDITLSDRNGRSFGIGSMVSYKVSYKDGTKEVNSTVSEIVLKEDGRILVKTMGHKTRPVMPSEIEVVNLDDRESVLNAEFARRGVRLSPDELHEIMTSIFATGGEEEVMADGR